MAARAAVSGGTLKVLLKGFSVFWCLELFRVFRVFRGFRFVLGFSGF